MTLDERSPFLSIKGCEGYWPSWEEQGERNCPQGARWSLLLSAAVRAWAPLEDSAVGTGAPPHPPRSDPCPWWGRGKGQGTGVGATPELTMHLHFFKCQ